MTRYVILARSGLGPFDSATEAVLAAALLGLPLAWDAVAVAPLLPVRNGGILILKEGVR